MTHDQCRKKVFEYECLIGEAIKVTDQLRDALLKSNRAIDRLSDINKLFANGIKNYLDTMDKQILVDAVNEATKLSKHIYEKI